MSIIIASTAASAAEPFTPKWLEGTPGAPTFYIRAGDIIERQLMEAELSGPAYNAGEIWPWEKHGALIDGISAFAGEDTAHLIALAETAAKGELVDPAEIQLLQQVTQTIAQHFPAYRALVEREERRRAVLPMVAFCRYCVDWENVEGRPVRGINGQIDPATLTTIEPLLLRVAGMEAYDRQYGLSARKNSDAPLKSGDDQETSPSAEPSETDGSSPGSDTEKTPA
ncbi:hypothetical protein [Sphingobium yanoikuyae]|uniref:hypothetical protein n=1 Tax=Sphingobium yanoikuyae TaxID=13690 RepID=UPI0028AC4AA2|nr:hypothetical protein [Sphingobium yanoikuyae]